MNINHIKEFIDAVRAEIFPDYFEAGGVRSALEKMVDESVADAFIARLPEISRLIWTDVEAVMQNDPAAASEEEIVLCYPAINVMIHYRSAHELYLLGVKTLPRIITEKAHSENGVDIHPAATIGEYFAIDHGTGIVIGATCKIGSHVMLYQGVTLGAKNFHYDENGRPRDIARHPTIGDNVTIYSNASVLGNITIGHDSVIGGNVWLTQSVAPHSRVLQSKVRCQDLFEDGAGI